MNDIDFAQSWLRPRRLGGHSGRLRLCNPGGLSSKLNVRADAHALPFRDKAFARCRCWHVLERVQDPPRVLSEIRRVSSSADVRFPVDEGYKMQMLIGVLKLGMGDFQERLSYISQACS
jgi:hypothetical protein